MLSEEAVLAIIRRTVCTIVPEVDPGSVTRDRRLAELGCNSVDRADILTTVMEELALTVPMAEVGSGHDVGALVRLFQRYS